MTHQHCVRWVKEWIHELMIWRVDMVLSHSGQWAKVNSAYTPYTVYIYICTHMYMETSDELFSGNTVLFFVGSARRRTNGSAGLLNCESNVPSGVKVLRHYNFRKLPSQSVRPLMAICRYPLFLFVVTQFMSRYLFFGGLSRKKPNSGADPIIA